MVWHLTAAPGDAFGLLLDTGARGSLAGLLWYTRYRNEVLNPNHAKAKLRKSKMNFHGVGHGSMLSKVAFEVPIQI